MMIHQLFEKQVKLTPDEPAIEFNGKTLSYSKLNSLSNQIANYLVQNEIQKGSIVGVHMDRGFELIATLIGILKAGCAYLPLDKQYPLERLQYMVDDSNASLVISDATDITSTKLVSPSNIFSSCYAGDISLEGELAYVIYTSGSTGKPKGVCLDHSALENLLAFQATENRNCRTLQFTPISFDVHFQEIFSTLTTGGMLVLVDELTRLDFSELLNKIIKTEVERIFLPFVALNKLSQVSVKNSLYPSKLQYVTTAGEQLRITKEIRSFFTQTKAVLYNHYGPSETHVVTSKVLSGNPQEWSHLPAIGSILPNCMARLESVENGEKELIVGGKSVGLGYLGKPEQTAEKFFVENGVRFYRTGDIVELVGDELIFVRRKDNQIKIRGYRVELGEIETAISSLLANVDVTATIIEQENIENYICAYIQGEFCERELRLKLSNSLPEYMVPRYFEKIDALPMTPSGKVDKKRLPIPTLRRPELIQQFEAVGSNLESDIENIWKKVLGLDVIGVDDPFFDLGGTSLGAMTVLEELNQLGLKKLTIFDLFSLSTIRKQAKFLTEKVQVKKLVKERHYHQDIAIIAMTGEFPGASDLNEFKKILENADCGLQKISKDELHPSQTEMSKRDGFVFVKGEIKSAKAFDHKFFNMTPREAELMDPQQRKFLECSYNALEGAGYLKQRENLKIGVFAGSANNTYQNNLRDFPDKVDQYGDFNVMILNEKDYLATKTAYKLSLNGPAVSLNTGCSTSLVAIIQAVNALRTGQADLALAGGVSINGQRNLGYLHQKDSIRSKDGFCRAFDKNATGTIFTEGVGVVVLKPLEKAIEDGDYIYSVIKGVGINNDGSDKLSFSAPSPSGQSKVIMEAMLDAGIQPKDLSFVEAHGTGTPIGDPIEVSALQNAYAQLGELPSEKIKIGSLKTNIGHTTSAAGVAGLIKTCLSLHHRVIYQSLFCTDVNPKLGLENSVFEVASSNQPLKKEKIYAGVSSFGIGGTNAHIVLSNYENKNHRKIEDEIFILSGPSQENLELTLASAYDLEGSSLALASRPMGSVCAAKFNGASDWVINNIKKNQKLIFAFPGQGSQFLAMGKELRDWSSLFLKTTDDCFDIAAKYLELDLRDVLYGVDGDIINDTYYTQPAIFIYEYALAKLLESLDVNADSFIGHSVGEFVAATLNGVFSIEDAIKAICKRSELMSSLDRGAMVSIASTLDTVQDILPEQIQIAAINAPNSIVVAGSFSAAQSLEDNLIRKNIAFKRLHTSHAFHSSMMNPMIKEFEDFMSTLSLNVPKRSFVSTVTGKFESELFATPSYWANHVAATVKFFPALDTLIKKFSEEMTLLEVGPRTTLSSLAKRIDKNISSISVSGRDFTQEKNNFLKALASLVTLGTSLSLDRFLTGPKNSLKALTKFKSTEHWLDINDNKGFKKMKTSSQAGLQKKIIEIFEDASGIDISEYSPDTCFFEMGMDSLFLTQVALKLKTEFNKEISFRQLTEELADLNSLSQFYQDIYIEDVSTKEVAPDPVFSSPAMVNPINITAGGIEGIVQAQLQIMQTQLSLLSGQSHISQAAIQSQPKQQSVPQAKQRVEVQLEENTEEAYNLKAELNNTKQAFGAIARIETQKQVSIKNEFIEKFIENYNAQTIQSKNFTQDSRKDHADPRAVTGFKPEHKEIVYPIVVKASKDQELIDLDDNRYIDMLCGFGSNFFGNRNKHIQMRIQEQMDLGYEIGPQHPLTKEVSGMINDMTGNERTAFCNTGSEAVLGAMRIARTISGKKKIISFNGSYHGINDEVIIRGSKKGDTFPAAPGINKDAVSNMIVLEYGEDSSFQTLSELIAKGDVAAVIVEPVQSRRSDFHPKEFLKKVRELTLANDVCLIFDEVITGFRIALGGAQEFFGIRADLCTYGKIVGGGMPIGVVSGKAKFMDALDGGHWQYGDDSVPTVGVTYFAGTFVRHPLALAAAKGALEVLKEIGNEGLNELNRKADKFVQDINSFCLQVNSPLRFANFGALMKPKWDQEFKYTDIFFAHLRMNGIHCYDGFPWFINLAHTDAQLLEVSRKIKSSVAKMQEVGLMQGGSIYQSKEVMHSDLPPRSGLTLGRDEQGFPKWFDENSVEVKL